MTPLEFKRVLEAMWSMDNFTMEVAINCIEQNIENFVKAYYIITMHNLQEGGRKK